MRHMLFTLRHRHNHQHLLFSLSRTHTTLHSNSSLKPHLLELSLAIPEATRTCWRLPVLGPSHVLHLLLALQSHPLTLQKVRSLWEIFKWGGAHKNVSSNFKHLPQSREIMASLLLQVGLFKEAEELVFELQSSEIFYDLIKGYVGLRDWEKSVFVYDVMKGRGKVPSRDCYNVLIDLLLKVKRMDLVLRVAFDFLDLGVPLSGDEVRALEKVMVLLCIDGKIQEARNMVKRVLELNSEVSSFVFDEIAFGYCERKDYKDLVSFFVDVKCAPSVRVANRVMDSLCRSYYGVDTAALFLQELEGRGFISDEVTFGILIGWSCREGKMRNALSWLSVMQSKSFVPRVYTYNALISGLFKVGMLDHASEILDEMIERGTLSDVSTFRVLIAGYCKARRFDKVKILIHEMENRGLIQLSMIENPISMAFRILGLDPLSVKLKRDNDGKLSKTEFFDDVGT